MNKFKMTLSAVAILAAGVTAAKAEPNVVASIKPVHSLVAAVMAGAGKPALIVQGAGSPHDHALKPSQAKLLQDASIVFWVGRDLETFLAKPIDSIAAQALSIELIESRGLEKLPFRDLNDFADHAHDGHDKHVDHDEHEIHAEHADGHDEHEHEGHDERDEHEHENHAGHDHSATDAHVWLDPQNAKILVDEITEALVKIDPAGRNIYQTNRQTLRARLDALTSEIDRELAPVRERRFVVFHDSYQYFERRFGMKALGSITLSPEIKPGAERLGEIKDTIKHSDADCVFSEPQFDTKLVAVVTEGTATRTAVLDPLGATVTDGPDLYFALLRNMAASFKACLSGTS